MELTFNKTSMSDLGFLGFFFLKLYCYFILLPTLTAADENCYDKTLVIYYAKAQSVPE